MQGPPAGVLDAFGIQGTLARSTGGMQGVFLAGDFILKYYSNALEAQYICACYQQLRNETVVVPQPLTSSNQRLVEDGWIAYPRIPAKDIQGDHAFRYEVARTFNERTRDLPWRHELDERDDPWSSAHRIALGVQKLDPNHSPQATELITRLLELCRGTLTEPLVYHGDLANNILLHDGGRPVVLDFSPVRAPHRYAEAIFLVDIFAYQKAPAAFLSELLDDAGFVEFLIRATVFRLACSAEFERRFHTTSFLKEAAAWMQAFAVANKAGYKKDWSGFVPGMQADE